MTILDKLRTLAVAASIPRPVRAIAAGAAVAWGTAAAAAIAQECGDEITTAEGRLEEIERDTLEHERRLAELMKHLATTPDRYDRLQAASRVVNGELDAVAKARAAAIGWGPPVDVDQLASYIRKDAQEVELRAGETAWVVGDVAAAIRHYFSPGGPGGPQAAIDEPAAAGELVDESADG